MSRLPFLTSPGSWVRTGSRTADPVRDAYAIKRPRRTHPAYSVILAVAIGVVLALLLVHHLAK